MGLFTYLCIAAKNTAKEWITEEVKVVVREPDIVKSLLSEANKNIVGLSYQDYFKLGGKGGEPREHYMPIYVQKDQKVFLIMSLENLAETPLNSPSLQIYINHIRVNNDNLNKQNDRKINLTDYVKQYKEGSSTSFDENVITVGFRLDPTVRSNAVVSVKALVNIMGLSAADEGFSR